MEITFLGWLALILTLVFIINKDVKLFLYSAVFFSGFSGASVLNIASFSLQPSYYFFIIYFICSLLLNFKLEVRLDKALIIFLGYCFISVLFPFIYKNSNITIMDQEGAYSLLKFSISNIVHISYLLFVLLFLNSLLKYKNQKIVVGNILKSYKLGFFAVILICIYQFISFKFGWEFDYFFRQGVHGNIQGTRLYGPCDEASMLCCYLIPSMLFVWQNRKNLIDIIAIIVSLFIGFSTRSSTFLVGTVLFIIVLIPDLIKIFTQKHDIIFWTMWILGAISVVFVLVRKADALYDTVSVFIIKLNEGNQSGFERLTSMRDMINVGLHYPTGVGFGSCRSKDLFSTWLCNVGVIGIWIFILYIINLILKCSKQRKIKMFLPFGIVLCLLFVSVPEPYFLFVWFFAFYSCLPLRKRQQNVTKLSLIDGSVTLEMMKA